MKPSTAQIQVEDLDHYGIIAGIIDEIGLVEKINELVGTHYRLSNLTSERSHIIRFLSSSCRQYYLLS